ncbi:glycosyltransferase family 2 protein [Thioclava nitratireducens]|uniref:glycosyltransferase family 2 protein n=1 Tax=Thioclava nitratireducens TaxID=1915078 RepID=UPI002481587C|nr:glycosyltransferase family 2 protein [Thioclava nitratireducens]WGT52184.1 glycosyltransferase family 2 protein [Thioclava nitratireducens]
MTKDSAPEAAVITPMRICIITLMKNEGPFILEWLAHWRNLGVTDFIVFSNDCFDGTDAILDRLDALGVVQHLPNPAYLADTKRFHRQALAYGSQLRRHREADYTMICDTDEFLHIDVADGTLPGLLALHDYPDAISFGELLFGFGGRESFEEGLVTERFTWAIDMRPGARRARRGVKTIAKVTPTVLEWNNHRPQMERRRGIRWLDGAGVPVPRKFRVGTDRGYDVRGRYDQAWLAHYSVRSAESLLLKMERGDAVRPDRLTANYARKRSSAREDNLTMLRYGLAIRREMGRFLEDPVLSALHTAAIDAHHARIAELKADLEMAEVWKTFREVCQTEIATRAERSGTGEAEK